jgi:hypothetical protein
MRAAPRLAARARGAAAAAAVTPRAARKPSSYKAWKSAGSEGPAARKSCARRGCASGVVAGPGAAARFFAAGRLLVLFGGVLFLLRFRVVMVFSPFLWE